MRLIDADALIEKTDSLFKDLNSTEDFMGIGYNHGVGDSIATIKNAPTIEAEPVKRGKWLYDGSDGYNMLGEEFRWKKCSLCGYSYSTTLSKSLNYCPNCGARMSEGSEE